MGRASKALDCGEATKSKLLGIARSRKAPPSLTLRARIVLACIEGGSIRGVASALGVAKETVVAWKRRFAEHGAEGLSDRRRSGRPPVYRDGFGPSVLEKLEGPPPEGFGRWDGALLAKELGCSKDAVWRFLRAQGISLARKRTWCASTGPEFAAKAADVVGLYLAKHENALVVCVDEKPNMQALGRRAGYVFASDRKLVRGIESTYRRNGAANLFAALEVATGRIHGKVTDSAQKTKKGFLAFMEGLLRELPGAEEYHVILDNHSIHKRHEAWLLEHPNVFFHYTPTNASWMNMVEIWLGILARKSLAGAGFANTEALCRHIGKFIEAYNETAKPFVWRKREVRGAQLTNSIRNLCN